MANNALKITEMTACSAPATTDKFYLASNTSGNAVPRSLTVNALFSNVSGGNITANNITSNNLTTNNIIISSNSTPANSTANAVSRRLWFDSDFIYVATANNTIKRAALSSTSWTTVSGGSSPVARERLQENRTYYIRTDGSNDNNGLTNTSGGAWATLTYAWKFICQNIDMNGHNITFQLAAGTYTGGFSTYGDLAGADSDYSRKFVPVGGGIVTIQGNTSDKTAVTVTGGGGGGAWTIFGIEANCQTHIKIQYLTLDCLTTTNWPIRGYGKNTIDVNDIVFTNPETNSSVAFTAFATSQINISGALTIGGAWGAVLWSDNGTIVNAGTWTISGTTSWSDACAYAAGRGFLSSWGTWTGSPTGKRYHVGESAYMSTAGGVTHFPGSTPGTVASGGLYSGASATATTRDKLLADRTYYVRSNGSNSNDGLTDTSTGAWASLGYAWKWICRNIDMNGFKLTIQIGDGTYTGGLTTYGEVSGADSSYAHGYAPMGGGTIYIQGNSSDKTAVVINPAATSDWAAFTFAHPIVGTQVYIKDLTMGAAAGEGYPLIVNNSQVWVVNCKFQNGHAVTYAIQALNRATVTVQSTCVLAGSGWAGFADVLTFATVTLWHSGSLTLSDTPAWGTTMFNVRKFGHLERKASFTFSGSATGKRYDVVTNGLIEVNGGSSTLFPGDVVGTTATQGQYI